MSRRGNAAPAAFPIHRKGVLTLYYFIDALIDVLGGFWLALGHGEEIPHPISGAVYHVMNRGDRHEEIFRGDQERNL